MCFSIYLYLELRTRWKSPFPDLLKRIDQRSLLPPPLLPISGKRRKTNWAVEPLEFSICPKLTPELSRLVFAFSEFLVFLSSPARSETEISTRFIPPKRGRGRRNLLCSIVIPRGEKGLICNFTGGTSLLGFWPPPLPPRFQRRLVLTLEPSKTTRASLCVLCVRCYIQGKEGCNVVIKLLRKMEIV